MLSTLNFISNSNSAVSKRVLYFQKVLHFLLKLYSRFLQRFFTLQTTANSTKNLSYHVVRKLSTLNKDPTFSCKNHFPKQTLISCMCLQGIKFLKVILFHNYQFSKTILSLPQNLWFCTEILILTKVFSFQWKNLPCFTKIL